MSISITSDVDVGLGQVSDEGRSVGLGSDRSFGRASTGTGSLLELSEGGATAAGGFSSVEVDESLEGTSAHFSIPAIRGGSGCED